MNFFAKLRGSAAIFGALALFLSGAKPTDFDRKGRKVKAAKDATKFKFRVSFRVIGEQIVEARRLTPYLG